MMFNCFGTQHAKCQLRMPRCNHMAKKIRPYEYLQVVVQVELVYCKHAYPCSLRGSTTGWDLKLTIQQKKRVVKKLCREGWYIPTDLQSLYKSVFFSVNCHKSTKHFADTFDFRPIVFVTFRWSPGCVGAEPTPGFRLVATPETMFVELEIYSVATKSNQTFEPAIRWWFVLHSHIIVESIYPPG